MLAVLRRLAQRLTPNEEYLARAHAVNAARDHASLVTRIMR